MPQTIADAQDDLAERGYVETGQHGSLRQALRVRNRGEMFWEAMERGTATVEVVMRKEPSSWARSYGRDDVEVIVQHDDGSVRVWADYGTILAHEQPFDDQEPQVVAPKDADA